jgi:PAS domain S-box-containing protein
MELGDEKIRILLIEDNPGDARLIKELLTAAEGASFNLEHTDRLSTGLARLARGDIDVIMLDLSLPDSHGLDGLNKICAQTPKVPVVVMSGLSDQAVALNAVQEGAQDYLVKGNVDSDLLLRSLRYAIERQHLRVALSESEARYRLLADNAADVIWTANMKWQITYVSPSIKRLLGYTVEEMKRLAIKDILTPDSFNQAVKLIRSQMDIITPESQYPSLSLTLEHVRKDGSKLWAEVTLSFLWNKDGKLSEVLGVTRDITERKKAEEALRESKEELQAIFDSSGNGIALLDLEGRVIRVNKRILEVGGYDVEDISGKSLDLLKMFTPESIERMLAVMGMVLSGHEVTTFECELCTKSGIKMSLEINVGPFFLKGQLFGLVAVMTDITERKRAEESLRESEARYRLLAENMKDVITVVDMNLRPTYISPSVTQLLGYNVEEALAMSLEEGLTPASFDVVIKAFSENLTAEASGQKDLRDSIVLEGEAKHKNGRPVPIEMGVNLLRDAEGKSVGILGVTRDITERKKAEQELRRLSDAVRMSTDSIVISDLEGNIVDVNEATVKIQGANGKADLIGLKSSDFIAPEEQEKALSDLSRLIEVGYVNDVEYHIATRDGRRVLVETNASVMRGENGEPVGVVAITRDITERKRMEEALKENEERFRVVFEGTSLGIALVDMKANVLGINPAFQRLLGYSLEEFRGIRNLEYLYPEDAMADADLYIEMLKGKRDHYTIDKRYIRKDGEIVWGRQNLSVVRDAVGKPVYFIAMIEDITQRKLMEEALRQSEHNYRLLFEGTIDGMFVTDAETIKVVLANQTAVRMFGLNSVEDAIGGNPIDLVHPDDRERVLGFFMEDVAGEGNQEVHEFRAITKDGREIWISGMGTRIEYGGKLAVLSSIRDVTERKRMEEERQRMEEQLRLAGRLAAVGELSAGVAHELNNPIAAIQGFAQFLAARKGLDEDIRKDLNTIYRESQRAAKITQNLLSFARKHDPEKHLISINDVIENILEMQDHLMKINNIELEVELDPDLPKTMADFHQMQQVFMNIVNNAEQAMIEAQGRGKLVVKTKRAGKIIQISFADNGPGISEENMKRIFDPFFTTKEVGKGTGLGLSICYGLVEAHGGRIYARSKLGQGATFVVELPIASRNELVVEAALLKPGSRGAKWKKQKEQY